MSSTKPDSVLIIGGGAWGLSTSLELIRNGYKNVAVLDPYAIPSPIAAGNDVNKIVESPDNIPAHELPSKALKKSQEIAIKSWLNDPVYKPYYHQTGVIFSSSSELAYKGLGSPKEYQDSGDYVEVKTAEEFRKTMPQGVLTGDFPNWKGWYRKDGAGWCQARKTLEAVHKEALKLGVRFITGDDGNVAHLIMDGKQVKGVRAHNGTEHFASLMVLAAGSYSNEIFDFENQLRPTAWTLAHIQMKPEELKQYRNLPVLFNNEMGFFMEPDYDRGELKMCDEHPGYINYVDGESLPKPVPGGPSKTASPRSIPFARQGLPKECETRLRYFLANTMPHLQNREFCYGRICWDSDTVDRVFLIDKPPKCDNLIVAVGASGHGIMNMPTAGKIVRNIIENKNEPLFAEAFRWRPEKAANRDIWDKQKRFGHGPYNKIMNFQTVDRWIDFKPRL